MRYAGGLSDKIEIPDKEVKGYRSETDYRFLEDDGIVYTEAKMHEENVVIGRTSPPRFLSSTDEYNLSAKREGSHPCCLNMGRRG